MPTAIVDPCVGDRIFVALWTMRTGCNQFRAITAYYINLMCDWLKVLGIYAASHSTKMIQFET